MVQMTPRREVAFAKANTAYRHLISGASKLFVALLVLASSALAQKLLLVPSIAQAGAGSILVSLVSPAGKNPVGLQWTIRFEPPVTIELKGISVGETAAAAGKQITCAAGKESSPDISSYKCVLVGGTKSIANGTAIVINYRISDPAVHRVANIRLVDCLAVLRPYQNTAPKVEIADVSGAITIN